MHPQTPIKNPTSPACRPKFLCPLLADQGWKIASQGAFVALASLFLPHCLQCYHLW